MSETILDIAGMTINLLAVSMVSPSITENQSRAWYVDPESYGSNGYDILTANGSMFVSNDTYDRTEFVEKWKRAVWVYREVVQ